jgi:hypothetical protein
MTKPADDGNNITTMKALVFHGPNRLALEDSQRGRGRGMRGQYDKAKKGR